MKKSKKEQFVDDGRTIANMNVEGMPWYNPKREDEDINKYEPDRMETLSIIGGVLKAALLIAAVFVIVFLLFILFTENIWLH